MYCPISCHSSIVYSFTVQMFCTVVWCSCCVQLYNATVVYSCTMPLLCILQVVFVFSFKCIMPCIIHKTGNRITSYHALLSEVTSCYNMQSCLSLRAGRTAMAGGALLKLPSLGKPEDIPQVNGGFTRPKGPSHPAEGQGVNCPPLGPPGHWSSPGGTTDLSV